MPQFDVSICICAYKRPELLNTLLSKIQLLDADALSLQIVVADNDADMSSAAVIDQWRQISHFPIVELRVPIANIALARNACVASAGGEWIAFIDDDEWPDPAWILNLYNACRIFSADIAFGPVLPVFLEHTPAWITEGGFFDRPRRLTGAPASVHDARTSNALVRREILIKTAQPFDSRFGRTGGSDHVLFKRLAASGVRMVWADDAIVHEHLPAERTTLRWLLRRSFRTGEVATRANLLDIGMGIAWQRRAAIALRAGGNFLTWTLIALLRAPFHNVSAVRAALESASYLGKVLGALGHRYQEYRH